ncbi:MAG: universal stress protein [Saprospiraceae bacterium]|nr:universal stress protein [Saprospiraceae bacterium]
MKKILVPTDFSENARHALNVAAAVAAKAGARLEVLHTNTAIAYAPPLPEYYTPENFDTAEYYETAANELFNLKSALLAENGNKDLNIETRVEEGFLHTSIRRVADEDTVDLIVMGTKGATGAVEFFVGSNTEKVIRTAHCPVLAVPETSGEFNPKVVVLATTLRHDQLPAFQKVAEWQKVFPFEVRVLYLNNPAGFDSSKDIEKAAHDFCSQAHVKNATVFISGNTFNEASSILQFADEQSADLIAMATHQRQGLSHLLFGSLTEDTANHSDVPVLSIPM